MSRTATGSDDTKTYLWWRTVTAEQLHLVVGVANTVTLLVGGYVTLLAVRAQRRTGSGSLRALAIGLACITGGTLVGGLVHLSGLAPLLIGVTLQSVSIAVGFVFLGWSLLQRTGDGDRLPLPAT